MAPARRYRSTYGGRTGAACWAVSVEERRGRNVTAVALVNKNARTAWALLAQGTSFDAEHVGAAA